MDIPQRLNKLLSSLGYTSRRNIQSFLQNNNLTINGVRVFEGGVRVDTKKDQILLNGEELAKKKFVYFLLNKPKGVVSTAHDEHNRKTVVDLVDSRERVYPVGRLDQGTAGLLILTNDGELTLKLTHPKFHVPKTYLLTFYKKVGDKKIDILRQGVRLASGEMTLPAEVKILEANPKRTVLELIIMEGKNHQIKKMCNALKLNLIHLKRVAIGNLKLGDLKEGQYRKLTKDEIVNITKHANTK